MRHTDDGDEYDPDWTSFVLVDFTYTNAQGVPGDDDIYVLEGGAAKLTVADLNEEGANLLALQTRQQLGIQSLSFAGQSEQSILGLFR